MGSSQTLQLEDPHNAHTHSFPCGLADFGCGTVDVFAVWIKRAWVLCLYLEECFCQALVLQGGVPTSQSRFPALQLWAHNKSQPVVHQLQTKLQYKRAVQLPCVWTKQALRKRVKPTLLSEIRRQKVNWETPPLSARDDSRASQTGVR